MSEAERLEQRIRMLMRDYVCYRHEECFKGDICVYTENGDEHLCKLGDYEKELKKTR